MTSMKKSRPPQQEASTVAGGAVPMEDYYMPDREDDKTREREVQVGESNSM